MRWIVFLFLWVVAVVLAVLILRRVRRGKPVVLTGRWSPRVVRMIVVVLVVLGVGEEVRPPDANAAPAKTPIRPEADQLPPTIKPHHIQLWLAEHQENGPYSPGKRELARALAGQKLADKPLVLAKDHVQYLPEKLQKLVQADLSAALEGKDRPKATDAELTAALDELEKKGRFDHFWNGYLWRKAAASEAKDPEARITLFARIRQHARVTDALIRAHAQVKPLMQPPRAWMSKAGPKPADRPAILAYQTSMQDMVKVANELLPTTDEGTWKRDGIAQIKPVAGTVTLVRGGKERALPADESTRFGRLDLLKTGEKPAAIRHEWLGKIDLPANRLVSVWDLPTLLPDAAKQKLDETVHEALKDNSEEAADRLERALPLAHAAIRAGLKELPAAKGAPRLRLILSLFDDAVMPSLPTYRTGEGAEELGGGRRGAKPPVGR